MKKQTKKTVKKEVKQATPKLTKENQMFFDFLKQNNFQIKLEQKMNHADPKIAEAFRLLGATLGVKFTVTMDIVKTAKEKKK